jgi:hypothetical protein
VRIVSDGTNYWTVNGAPTPGSAGTNPTVIYLDGSVAYPQSQTGIANALSALTALGGGTVEFPPMNINIGSQLNIPAGVPIRFQCTAPHACTLTKGFTGTTLINASGSLTVVSAAVSNVSAGSNIIIVNPSNALSPGEWIAINDTSIPSGGSCAPSPNPACYNAELQQIAKISGTMVTLRSSLDNGYTSPITLQIVDPAYFSSEGMTYAGTGVDGGLVWCVYSVSCDIRGNVFTGGTLSSGDPKGYAQQIQLEHSINWTVEDNLMGTTDLPALLSGGSVIPIGVQQASAYGTITNNHFYSFVENAIGEHSHHVSFRGNTCEGFADDCINDHDAGYSNHDLIYQGNVAANTANVGNATQAICFYSHGTDYNILIDGNTCMWATAPLFWASTPAPSARTGLKVLV